MSNFYNSVIRNSKAFRSDSRYGGVDLLEPGTRKAVADLIAEAHEENIDIRLLETYRSQTRQSALFVKKVTQLRTVGTHGYGVAADFGVFVNGKYAEDNKPYLFLRVLARRHGLISGQDWGKAKMGGFVDSGHVQRVPVWRQQALFGGTWYPPENYDPYEDSLANGHPEIVATIGEQYTPKVPVIPTLVYGSVAWVQAKLNAWAPSFKLVIDGVKGPKTDYAVRRYREEAGFSAGDDIDAALIAALDR